MSLSSPRPICVSSSSSSYTTVAPRSTARGRVLSAMWTLHKLLHPGRNNSVRARSNSRRSRTVQSQDPHESAWGQPQQRVPDENPPTLIACLGLESAQTNPTARRGGMQVWVVLVLMQLLSEGGSQTTTPNASVTPSPSGSPFSCPLPDSVPAAPLPFDVLSSGSGSVLLGNRAFCSGRGSCVRPSNCVCDSSSVDGFHSGTGCNECTASLSHWTMACGHCDTTATLAAGFGSTPRWGLLCTATNGSGACAPAMVPPPLWAGLAASGWIARDASVANRDVARTDENVVCPSGFTPCAASLTLRNASLVPALGTVSGAADVSSTEASAASIWPRSLVRPRCKPCGAAMPTVSNPTQGVGGSAATCSGHGSCISADSPSGVCQCQSGWGGHDCSQALSQASQAPTDACSSLPCGALGVCFLPTDDGGVTLTEVYRLSVLSQRDALQQAATANSSFRCACLPGTSGASCSSSTTVTAPSPTASPTATPSVTPSSSPFLQGAPSPTPTVSITPSPSPLSWGNADRSVQVAWTVGQWSPCTSACGAGGISTRNLTCVRVKRETTTGSGALLWEDWPEGVLTTTPNGCGASLPLASRPITLRSCGDWSCAQRSQLVVMDLVTGVGSDGAVLALTAAQHAASSSLLQRWVSQATSISRERVQVIGFGPIPNAGVASTASRMAMASLSGSYRPLWARVAADDSWRSTGTRVLFEVVPTSSRAVVTAVLSKGAPANTLQQLEAEPSPQDVIRLLNSSSALSGNSFAAWASLDSLPFASEPVHSNGAFYPLPSPTAAPTSGLTFDWILGLSITGAVIAAVFVGIVGGYCLFQGWWCCVWVSGRGVSRAEKIVIERGNSWRKAGVLRGGRLNKAVHKRSSVVPMDETAEDAKADRDDDEDEEEQQALLFAPPGLAVEDDAEPGQGQISPEKSDAFGSRNPDLS
jgi:hypothetical protein